uniref:Uncharacterized protein n=1 Tax=viral metagenome TaxID=1070528 RepID=A0A6C0CMS0_9ZZZZ
MKTPLAIEIYCIHTWLALGQSCRILVVTQYRYRQILTRRPYLTTTANREFTQNETPLAIEIYCIHTCWLALGQSCRILVGLQYRYQQSLNRQTNLTTTANGEFTQMKTPLAKHFHRIHTGLDLGQSCRILVETLYRYRQILYSKQNLTTTANREFTQNETPLDTFLPHPYLVGPRSIA